MSCARFPREAAMARIRDPQRIDHATLRAMAIAAVWVSELEAAARQLEAFIDVSEDRPDDIEVWEDDQLAIAHSISASRFEEADRDLEARAAEWLAQDPEHWPMFRLIILDPWRTPSGHWRRDTPAWVRVLSTNVVHSHFQQDP